jgi:hypothetical protein
LIEPIHTVNPISVYYENRISTEKKWARTISIVETPHITYDKNGNLISVPDQSFSLGPKYV